MRAATKTAEDAAGAEAPEEPEKTGAWDPERVTRHLERAAAQAYQLYRRARWLALLHDCDIVYREPDGTRTRLLRMRDGELREATDVDPEHVQRSDLTRARRHRVPGGAAAANRFDRETYDRLRILCTELKRIQRDGGFVAVSLGTRAIPARLLAGIQRLV
jgi:hypothetical protein